MIHKDEIHDQIMKKINLAIIVLAKSKLTIDIKYCEVNMLGYAVVKYDGESKNSYMYKK